VFYPIWHLEVESLIGAKKQPRRLREPWLRHLDYGVQFNRLDCTNALIKGSNIRLFSPNPTVPGLYDALSSQTRRI